MKIDIQLFSLLLLLFILLYSRQKKMTGNYSLYLFKRILEISIILTVVTILTWSADGRPSGGQFIFLINTLSFCLTPLPVAAWLSYIDYNIFNSRKGVRKRLFLYLIPAYIIFILMILNYFMPGLIFNLDDANRYSRGSLFIVTALINYINIIIVFGYFYQYKQMILGRLNQIIILYITIPVVASVIQIIFYGVALHWPLNVFAILVTFIYIELSDTNRDNLTGLHTRRQFDQRLDYKFKKDEPFSLILIDLNSFKYINDNYGHSEGDKVLKIVAEVLESSINHEDLACRYGGDEFILLIESDDNAIPANICQRINSRLDKINQNIQGYKISMSYGCEYVGSPRLAEITSVLQTVDEKMYDNKKQKKISEFQSSQTP